MLYATLGNVRLAKLLILLSFGGARRNRTDDLFNAIDKGRLIYQSVRSIFITHVYNFEIESHSYVVC